MTPDALAALHTRAVGDPNHAGWSRPWSAEDFVQLLSAKGGFVIANTFGFALGRAMLDEAELLQIATEPDVRGNGHGRRLLEDFESRAQSLGATRAFLEVALGNRAAMHLYQSSGWSQSGQRRNYYRREDGTFEDAAILTKTL